VLDQWERGDQPEIESASALSDKEKHLKM